MMRKMMPAYYRLLFLSFLLHNVSSFLLQQTRRPVDLISQRHFDIQRIPILLSASPSDNDTTKTTKARVRFLGVVRDSQSATVSNPADFVLSWIASDVGSIVLGLLGIVLLLVGRTLLDNDSSVEDSGQATRSNLLAVFAALSVLLNGLSKLDVESTMAQAVVLVGTTLPATMVLEEYDPAWPWALESLLLATPAETAVLLQKEANDKWNVVALAGTVPPERPSRLDHATPILDRTCLAQKGEESYLPTLQNSPGRTEFTYLPSNTQAALLLPLGQETVLVLGSDQARSFTPRDIAWCQVVVARLAEQA
jgi:hypothetical protein